MRLAVQDLNGSTIRKRALRLGRRDLWLLYQDLLWRLHDAGGYLPCDPAALVDEVDFFTAAEIAELLPLLEPATGKVGGIVTDKKQGRIYNQRVLDELADEQAFSQEQAAKGKRGGRARAKALRLAAAIDKDSSGQATAKRRPQRLKPSVAVSVAVAGSVAVTSPSSTAENVLPASPGEAPTALAVQPKPQPWNQRACDALIQRYGGTAPGGRITKALRPLVSRHGEESVLAAWANYLSETEAEYVSVERFASTFGRWGNSPPARAAPMGKLTRAAVDSSKAFLARHGGKSGVGSRDVQSGDEQAGDPATTGRGSR